MDSDTRSVLDVRYRGQGGRGKGAGHIASVALINSYRDRCYYTRLETYLIPAETLIPGGRGERFTLVLDMRHIYTTLRNVH